MRGGHFRLSIFISRAYYIPIDRPVLISKLNRSILAQQPKEVSLATAAITKALESADRRLMAFKRHKEALKIREERAYVAGTALVGAVVAGIADAKYRDADGTSKKIMKVPAVGLVSGALALAGISELVPGGVYIGMAGIGGLCYVLGKAAHDHQSQT